MKDFKEQLISLYKQSFDESGDYVDYFFQNRYKEENVAAVIMDGRVISALHLIPQKIMMDGKAVLAGYISSAATLPEFRGRGIFAETIAKADEMLVESGMDFCFLFPFKHEYYKKFDFIEYTYVKTRTAGAGLNEEIKKKNEKIRIEEYREGDKKLLNKIKDIYERLCGNFEGWVIRDDREWEYRIGEIRADKGIVLAVKADNKREGYCFINKGRIEECCFTDFLDGDTDGGLLIDNVPAAAGMEYTAPVCKPLNQIANDGLQIANDDNITAVRQHPSRPRPFGMIKKTGGTAAETYDCFKNKRCILLDKY